HWTKMDVVTSLLLFFCSLGAAGIFCNLPLLFQISLYENMLNSLGPGIFGPMVLQELWLYDNKLSRVDDDTFRNLTHLRLLVLSRNQISYVSEGAFRGLTQLGEVSLHSNRLTSLQARTFEELPSLNVLLQQNPWRCDKNILPLRNWLKLYPSKVNQTLVVCETPLNLQGEIIAMLADEDLLPVSPSKDPVSASTERTRPHTDLPKQSSTSAEVLTTPTSEQENETNGGQGGGVQTNNISLIIIGCVCWKRNRRGNENISQMSRNSVL
uniref:LRRCT domain-containing protein n=1 Tax=Poecilia latipinna TaxID=48699 RepID=A0A3B3UAN0_9TELE